MIAVGTMTGKVAAGRVAPGKDLLQAVEEIRGQAGISEGQVEIIGAVRRAVLSFYNQQQKQYTDMMFDQPLEIAAGLGNISIKEGKPFAHIHLTVADHQGKCYGGHLAPGTEVFAAEIFIRETRMDPSLKREYDEETGLTLWA